MGDKFAQARWYAKRKDDPEFRAKRLAKSRAFSEQNRESTGSKSLEYYYANSEKCNARAMAYHKAHPEARARAKHRMRAKMYGLTVEELDRLLLIPGCEICGTEFVDTKNKHVDHCYETGRARGLLCSGCNHGLGKFKDNSSALRKAADYLDRYK